MSRIPDVILPHPRRPHCAVRLPWCLLLILLAAGIPGCSAQRTNSDYIPEEEQGLRALTTALNAWQAGSPAGPVAGSSPLIHVTDSSRTSNPNQSLRSWEMLGPVPGNAPRCFAVRLQLENPTEEKRERFVVVGIDPLWVFRHEDYDLLAHWEHPMAPDQTVAGPETSSDAVAGESGETATAEENEQP